MWFAYLKLILRSDVFWCILYSLPGYVFLEGNGNVGTGGSVEIFLKHEIKFKRSYDVKIT